MSTIRSFVRDYVKDVQLEVKSLTKGPLGLDTVVIK